MAGQIKETFLKVLLRKDQLMESFFLLSSLKQQPLLYYAKLKSQCKTMKNVELICHQFPMTYTINIVIQPVSGWEVVRGGFKSKVYGTTYSPIIILSVLCKHHNRNNNDFKDILHGIFNQIISV